MNQLQEQSDREEIITSKQFGFRSFHSTVHPLLITKNYIETQIKKGMYVALVALDIEKAFDCVKTDGALQEKILHYTKSKKITNWIDSFYKDRVQITSWGNINSSKVKNHEISIVQGSNLGPKCFNIYINDLDQATNLLTVLFADDSNFLGSNKKAIELEKEVNTELENIRDYFNANKLSISIKKTTYMIFKPINKPKYEFKLKLGNNELKESKEITFLGVVLDNKLNFTPHFNKVYDNVKKGLNGLIMVKHQLDFKAKLKIFHSLIQCHLDYCALIWISSINKKQLNMLKVIQKKAIRIVCGSNYNSHTGDLFETNKITKVENIFERDSLLMTFKFQNKSLPKAILNLYENSLHDKNMLTRQHSSCILRPKNGMRNGEMMYDILDCWNRIGKNIREEKYFKDFKFKVKNVLNKYIACDKKNCYSCQVTTKYK